MTPEMVVELDRQALMVVLMLAAPPLLAALVVGLLVSVLQAATQINEQTLTFIPKLVATFIVIVLAGSWMLGVLTDFVERLYGLIPGLLN